MMNKLQSMLEDRGVLLADGGMGTALFRRGLETGDSPELWNVEHPDRIADAHREFIEAGSDIILTNSFGGNAMRLKLHDAQHRVAELNSSAARIARSVADHAGRPVLVAGSMGPTGEILEPVGTLSIADATAAFAEQARALADGGVDILWCETLSSAEELEAAVAGASATGLPVVCTMSFDTNGRTMMGLTPDAALAFTRTLARPPVAFGANCGIGPAQLLGSILGMNRLEHADDMIVAKGNCGIPEYRDGHIHYSGTPEIMATYAVMARDAGAVIIGGCCGTAGIHLAAMRKALDETPRGDMPDVDAVELRLGSITTPTDAAESHKRDRNERRRRRTS